MTDTETNKDASKNIPKNLAGMTRCKACKSSAITGTIVDSEGTRTCLDCKGTGLVTSRVALKQMMMREEGVVKIAKPGEKLFELSSGKLSLLFLDVKKAMMNPNILNLAAKEILSILPEHILEIHEEQIATYDRIASIATGGIPIGTAVSLRVPVRQVIVRSKKYDLENKSAAHTTGTKKR